MTANRGERSEDFKPKSSACQCQNYLIFSLEGNSGLDLLASREKSVAEGDGTCRTPKSGQ